MKKIIALTIAVMIMACAGGRNNQTNVPILTGASMNGNVNNTLTINNNYQGLDKQELIDSLNIRDKEISDLRTSTAKTVFKLVGQNSTMNPDGTYLTSINLTPVGDNIIPIFGIHVQTQNGTIIRTVKINPEPIMDVDSGKPGTSYSYSVQNFVPQNVIVTIITDKPLGNAIINISPFELPTE